MTKRNKPLLIDGWREHVKRKGDCLVWQRRLDRNGYPRLGGKWAHRCVYEHEVGPIPAGLELDHTCQNPPCVNPDHLDPVTRAEHVARTFRRVGKDDKHFSAAYLRTVGLTYAEIAQVLNYTSRTGAADAVNAAIRKGLVDPDAIPRADHLSEEDCADIRELRALGVPVGDLAEWYGVDGSTASRISRGHRKGGRERMDGAA